MTLSKYLPNDSFEQYSIDELTRLQADAHQRWSDLFYAEISIAEERDRMAETDRDEGEAPATRHAEMLQARRDYNEITLWLYQLRS